MVTTYGIVLLVIGIALMLVGAAGIWLAMNSPVQLQPIPLIALVIGVFVAIIGLVLCL